MTERWQRELKKLRQLEPPSTTWPRAQQSPRWDRPDSSRTGRVIASVVAFAVFAAAGVFTWAAFDGQPTTAGRMGPPGEQVVRIDLASGTDGDLAAVLRSGTADAAGTRFPVDVFGADGASFQAPDLIATYPPAGFARITPDATFRLQGEVQRGSVNAFLFRGDEIGADPKHLGIWTDLTQGEGDLTWDLEGVAQRDVPTKGGNRYLLAVMGRTLSGEEFGFSFGVEIQKGALVSEPTATPSDAADIPNVAMIRCTEAGTELLTPMVRPQTDGVHFEIDNQSQARAIAGWHADDPGPRYSYWASEFNAQDPNPTNMLPLEPDRYLVQCIDTRADSDAIDLRPEDAQPMEIIDVDGVLFPDRLSCSGGSRRYAFDGRPSLDGEEYIRDTVPGIQNTDIVGPAGYAGTAQQEWGWRVERDGRVVALIRLAEPHPTTIILDACVGSGIGEE
jgi:hypothetical protein